MAVVERGEPSIVTLAGATLDIEVMEGKNNDGTQEDFRGMEVKSEKDKAAQAGVCHMGKEGSVLQYQTEEEQVSLCEMEERSEKAKAAQTDVCQPGEDAMVLRYQGEEGRDSLRRWMRALKKQVKANRKARENTEDYLEARHRARRHKKLKRTQKKLKEALRGKRKAPEDRGMMMEGNLRRWKGAGKKINT